MDNIRKRVKKVLRAHMARENDITPKQHAIDIELAADDILAALEKPTEAMISAGKSCEVSHSWGSTGEHISDPETIWKAMLKAI